MEAIDDLVTSLHTELWNRDCIFVPHHYEDDHFQLLLTSTPYPGLADFHITAFNMYLRWWYERLRAWVPKINKDTGVIVQNIKLRRDSRGWFDDRQLSDLTGLYQTLGLKIIDLYIWDKINAPPAGNHERHDRDEYEFVYALARSHDFDDFTFNKFREPYAEKTIGKAKPGNKMRQSDVRGSHAGGHARLHPEGARQGNILRYSSSGDQGRPRVKGGVFPRDFAERMIKTFSNPGDWVVDPCAGSGTVPVVALQNDRYAVGVELDDEAFDVALQWVQKEEAKWTN